MFFSSRLNLIKRVGFGGILFMGMIPIWMNKYVFEGWNHQSMVFWPRNPKHICMTWSCLWFTVSVRVRMCWCIVVVERDASWTFKVYRYSRHWYLKFLQLNFFFGSCWKLGSFWEVFGFSFWLNFFEMVSFPKSKIYWHLPNLDILEHDLWQAPAHWSQHCWWPQRVASSPYGRPSDGCVNGDQGCWRIPCNSCFSYIFAVLCWRSEVETPSPGKSWCDLSPRRVEWVDWLKISDFGFWWGCMFRWCWSAVNFTAMGQLCNGGDPKIPRCSGLDGSTSLASWEMWGRSGKDLEVEHLPDI